MQRQSDLKIEMRRVADLIPQEGNVKQHPDSQLDHLVASIREFGFNDPVGIDPKGNIIEGHGRVLAAQRLGLPEVPCIVVDGLSDRERVAYAIAHNQTTLNTGLDNEMVVREFDDLGLKPEEFDAVGFTSDDMLFLRLDLGTEEGPSTDHNGAAKNNLRQFFDPVHTSRLEFDTQEQFAQFQSFVITTRSRYVAGGTVADRMMMFLDEYESLLEGV